MKFKNKYDKIMEAFKGPSDNIILKNPEIVAAINGIKRFEGIRFKDFEYIITNREYLTRDERNFYMYDIQRFLYSHIDSLPKNLYKEALGTFLEFSIKGIDLDFNTISSAIKIKIENDLNVLIILTIFSEPNNFNILKVSNFRIMDILTSEQLNSALEIVLEPPYKLYFAGDTYREPITITKDMINNI